MPATLRPVPLYFGDQRRRPFDRVSMTACRAIAQAARDLGVERADASDVYTHMRANRWRNPAPYYDACEATNRNKD